MCACVLVCMYRYVCVCVNGAIAFTGYRLLNQYSASVHESEPKDLISSLISNCVKLLLRNTVVMSGDCSLLSTVIISFFPLLLMSFNIPVCCRNFWIQNKKQTCCVYLDFFPYTSH